MILWYICNVVAMCLAGAGVTHYVFAKKLKAKDATIEGLRNVIGILNEDAAAFQKEHAECRAQLHEAKKKLWEHENLTIATLKDRFQHKPIADQPADGAPNLNWRRSIAIKPPGEEWRAWAALLDDDGDDSIGEWVVHKARGGYSISRSAGELIRHFTERFFENKADAVAFCEKQEYEMTREP
jgi:hypothetical protein